MDGFIGRQEELEKLRGFIASPGPEVAVIYGRRRIGKTSLIKEAFRGGEILYFEALEGRPRREQINHFMVELNRQLEAANRPRMPTAITPPATWKEAFLQLFEAIRTNPCPIVLDDLQWMANYRHELVSDLRFVWDGFLSTFPRQKLVLCGSIASFMVNQVLKASAFYGRIDYEMELSGFRLMETQALLGNRGIDEVMQAGMLTGGIPKYLQLLARYPSLVLAMEDLAFTHNGYLATEYDRLFTSHFAKHPGFERIMHALAEHPLGLFREALAEESGQSEGGQISILRDLESAGFISSAVPFDKGPESRQIKYVLTDSYTRFYFSFILPNLTRIRTRHKRELFPAIAETGAYHAWMGRSFEYLCLQHADLISEKLGFSAVDYTLGPYFVPSKKAGRGGQTEHGNQVDLVFDRADAVLTLCEMKYSRRPVGVEIIPEVDKKVELLEPVIGRKTIQRVLILCGEPTKALVNKGYFYRILDASRVFLS